MGTACEVCMSESHERATLKLVEDVLLQLMVVDGNHGSRNTATP